MKIRVKSKINKNRYYWMWGETVFIIVCPGGYNLIL